MNKTKKTAELLEFISFFFSCIYLLANPAILRLLALVLGFSNVKISLIAR
jgi:hypothetical protein